jgi:pyruvate dehydrogenase E2 component (dihydrolipoamide acetyltransferase)
MAEIVRMPKLSDTMTEGVVAEWHKKVGDNIESGELLAEIETDKATMEFESFQEGVLLHIGVEKGQTAPVDSILAILGEKGEDVTKLLKEEKALEAESVEKEDSKPTPTTKPITSDVKPQHSVSATPSAPAQTFSSNKSFPALDSLTSLETKASPLAKKLAEERGINLKFVNGTGTDGRIVKRDIDNFQGSATIQGQESFVDEPVSQMRKVIAQRLAESKFSAPHFYLTVSINMDNSIEARKAINNVINPSKISFNDLVVKAAAVSLKDHPKVNASWFDDIIRYNEHVHIGVAVAVEEGLLVPVISFANEKSLTQIGQEVKFLAQKAKDKKLQPEEWEGNTFTISNLGMFGIDEFTAIVNPPDACILAVGGIQQVPIVKKGEIVPGNIMKVTLSCDHRVVDGAVGSAFLNSFKNYLENPVLLLGKEAI